MINYWQGKVNMWYQAEGFWNTINRIKAIRLKVTRYLSGHPDCSPVIGIGLNSKGIPRLLGPLQSLLYSNDPDQLRMLFTLLLVSRVIPGWKDPDPKPIISPPPPLLQYENIVEEGKVVIDRLGLRMDQPVWTEPHLSTKSGPHGQAMLSSISELRLLTENQLEDIKTIGGDDIIAYMDSLTSIPGLISRWRDKFRLNKSRSLRRLSVVKDPEGKSRIIAVLDYWTQSALKPLHITVMAMLRRMKGDCTFNQQKFHSWLPRVGPYYSLDLSNATDRFPVEFQREILSHMTNPEYAKAWQRLLTEQEFTASWNQETYKYAAGQPMGAYSSWAIFTLCHHLVVRIAAMRAGYSPQWSKYALLGDDIVLTDSKVKEAYSSIMESLGVSISPTKSHVSQDTYEMAKRWIHRGHEITGAPIKQILKGASSISFMDVVQTINDIEDRWLHGEYTMASPGMFRNLYEILGVRAGYARLANKTYKLSLHPRQEDKHSLLMNKMYSFWQMFPPYLGCNKIFTDHALDVWFEWIAEAKMEVLENGLIQCQRNLFDFQKKAQEILMELVPEGGSPSPLLATVPPVKVAMLNIGALQVEYDKLKTAFTTGLERDIVFNKSARLGMNPIGLFVGRSHHIDLANKAWITFVIHPLVNAFITQRNDASIDPANPQGVYDVIPDGPEG